ncbi:molecular chaperone DnaJ [Actinomadura logoneensis]|uniref:Molecular chaperone DnaJ n=1 Tax=Actinomadura logoneensis TaxID=2293572 RepID=A0A372JDY9_9ACTN|nr:molecular chaperone DnaJ [Actinomadura logoneensis]RFU37608.1 molecular chaperone DnaJ [Actinomadura logoneensis]
MTPPLAYAEAAALLERAATPADVFGEDASEAEAARLYRRLARAVHPDATPDGSSRHFARLSELWRAYNAANAPVFAVGTRRFRLGETLASGDIAELYAAELHTTGRRTADPGTAGLRTRRRVVVKMPRDPADNDLMSREEEALRRLRRDGDRRFRAYAPELLTAFRHRDPGTGETRRVTVLAPLDGFVTFAEIGAAHPDGLDPRDAAWMWRRLLVALGFAHRAGVVHGAVLPEHVLVHPGEHGLVLADWCYSVTRPGGRVPAMVGRHADLYAPEIPARRAAVPATDVFMASRCVGLLMGRRAPAAMRRFLAGCVLPAPHRRPRDAWRLLAELDDLLDRLYGPRTFRPFTMPPGGSHG